LRFAVLGDLHISPGQHEEFARARERLLAHAPEALVCLGDLGDYGNCGTHSSFAEGRDYLDTFQIPAHAIIGNHDLECLEEFSSDAASVEAFCSSFDLESPYRTIELGDALGILLSSTGYRSNLGFRHEVSIDDEQLRWLRDTLEANRDRDTIVFSHSPPLGSQLRVLQGLHLRVGNAWLNQSNAPGRFSALLADHPQVRLWFSGHNHLGQQYSNSISHVGHCLFVHTGVISQVTRDGARQSRIVDMDRDAVEIMTVDHEADRHHLDLRFDLRTNRVERCSDPITDESASEFFAPPPFDEAETDAIAGDLGDSLLHISRGMLIEYDRRHRDPVGIVDKAIGSKKVRIANGALFIRGWLRERQVRANRDGYFFHVANANVSK
jgi:hypothetical protein